ncbi:cytochrome P450 [Hypoxylon sp. FL0890]|nr:cytochrome P450 [Hypoxylon sp. FL0890]
MLCYILLGFSSILLVLWHKLYPKQYPGIPYVEASARRISGDIPDLMRAIQATDEVTNPMFAVSSQKLGIPVAQVLFPRFRKPLIVVEDPLEVEDIIVRRHNEFDKAPTAVEVFAPMFPRGTLSQYTTPELKAQKRLWADTMHVDFLRKVVAPHIHKTTLELLGLWRLKASVLYQDQPFEVHEDFKNATLDIVWASLIGEEPGLTRFEIKKLRAQISGDKIQEQEPRSTFVKAEMAYISQAIARNAKTPMPTWAQKLETYTPRYRKFRSTVISEVARAMKKAVDRYGHLETGMLEADDSATCMMGLVLRRQIIEAKKAGKAPTDPTTDPNMLDEMFIMLVGGHDSTANALAWFVKFMEMYPAVQSELRLALKSAFPGPDPPTVDRILSAEIPYLDGTLEESLRLAGTSKGSLRQAVVDTEILGYKVPKGAEILLNFHINYTPRSIDESKRSPGCRAAIAKHGNCFSGATGRGLASFEPRRWLVKDENTGKETFNPYALPSLAFGGGYRGCFGRKLATIEFRIVAVLLILNLEFLELPEHLRTMRASEKLFRHPEMPFARVKVL